MRSFETGILLATMGVVKAFTPADVALCVMRHVRCDWGDIHPDDTGLNDNALIHGGRLFSVYKHADKTLWIITEADRSSTTCLLPEEY